MMPNLVPRGGSLVPVRKRSAALERITSGEAARSRPAVPCRSYAVPRWTQAGPGFSWRWMPQPRGSLRGRPPAPSRMPCFQRCRLGWTWASPCTGAVRSIRGWSRWPMPSACGTGPPRSRAGQGAPGSSRCWKVPAPWSVSRSSFYVGDVMEERLDEAVEAANALRLRGAGWAGICPLVPYGAPPYLASRRPEPTRLAGRARCQHAPATAASPAPPAGPSRRHRAGGSRR